MRETTFTPNRLLIYLAVLLLAAAYLVPLLVVVLNSLRTSEEIAQTSMTIESGALDIARLLLDHGADPNVRDDKYKATALGWADFFGRADFVKLITEKGGVT